MDFECKILTIDDDPEYGCTVKFCDTIEDYDESDDTEVYFFTKSKYLLIQRSYPEDETEIDWYTIETSESEIDYSQKDKMYV